MYVVFKSGGAQHRASVGSVLSLQKLNVAVGETISFNEVLMLTKGEDVLLGKPILSNCAVQAEVLEQFKAPKIEILKFRRRKHSMKRQGHRQKLTRVRITAIEAN